MDTGQEVLVIKNEKRYNGIKEEKIVRDVDDRSSLSGLAGAAKRMFGFRFR